MTSLSETIDRDVMRPPSMPEPAPATVAAWIAETEAERARYEAGLRKVPATA